MIRKDRRKNILIDLSQPGEGSLDLWKKKDDIKRAKQIFVEKLKHAKLIDAVDFWFKELRDKMILNIFVINAYERYMKDLFLRGILPLKNQAGKPYCIDELHFNRNYILNTLVNDSSLTDKEKRYCLKVLISFSKFLEAETIGFFKKFQCPAGLALSSTNSSPSPKMLTSREYNLFRNEIWNISKRDGLVFDLIYFTARPLAKILSMTLDQIDCENKTVSFANERNEYVELKINSTLSNDLKSYIEESNKYRKNVKNLFITNNGNPIFRTRFSHIFKKASEKANLGFIATSKMVQKSYIVELLKIGYEKEFIIKKLKLKLYKDREVIKRHVMKPYGNNLKY